MLSTHLKEGLHGEVEVLWCYLLTTRKELHREVEILWRYLFTLWKELHDDVQVVWCCLLTKQDDSGAEASVVMAKVRNIRQYQCLIPLVPCTVTPKIRNIDKNQGLILLVPCSVMAKISNTRQHQCLISLVPCRGDAVVVWDICYCSVERSMLLLHRAFIFSISLSFATTATALLQHGQYGIRP